MWICPRVLPTHTSAPTNARFANPVWTPSFLMYALTAEAHLLPDPYAPRRPIAKASVLNTSRLQQTENIRHIPRIKSRNLATDSNPYQHRIANLFFPLRRSKPLRFILILLLLSSTANASLFGKAGKKVSPKDFTHSQCATFEGEVFRERLRYSEACQYGNLTCKGRSPTKKILMWCSEEMLSTCFENESWVTPQHAVDIEPNTEIGTSSTHVKYKSGKLTTTLCLYYNE